MNLNFQRIDFQGVPGLPWKLIGLDKPKKFVRVDFESRWIDLDTGKPVNNGMNGWLNNQQQLLLLSLENK